MVDNVATKFLAGIIMVAALTTVFGRSNTPKVFDSIGTAGSRLVTASLGGGADIR